MLWVFGVVVVVSLVFIGAVLDDIRGMLADIAELLDDDADDDGGEGPR